MTSAAADNSETRNGEGRGWADHLNELYQARLAMAKLEVRHDIATTRRLGIVAGVGAVLALTGLPLLVSVLAQALAAWTQTELLSWTLAIGAVLLIVGGVLIVAGWRAFRRDFSGLRETLDELSEDQHWLKEMAEELARDATGG